MFLMVRKHLTSGVQKISLKLHKNSEIFEYIKNEFYN